MNIVSFIIDNLTEILKPIGLILAVITLIYIIVSLVLDDVKEFRKLNYCEEGGEAEDYIINKAIIMLGNEKIEIEVDYYEINRNIINIKGKDGELYVTDLKNVLLS
ncbi:hypothetical protein QTH09_17370 [Clostridium perfringens]|nr:hypothetical protein [Clostridium perfringens]